MAARGMLATAGFSMQVQKHVREVRKDIGNGTHNNYHYPGGSAPAHSRLRLWLVVPGKPFSLCAIILCRNCKKDNPLVVVGRLCECRVYWQPGAFYAVS
jgi:hypothetical protein